MPSSAKTPRLGLNSFSGGDKPKMDDFNYDNARLDQAVGDHLADQLVHLSAADRDRFGKVRVVAGSYVGTGTDNRTIQLAEAPALGIILTSGHTLWASVPSSPGLTSVLGGVFAPQCCTAGLSLSGRSLTLRHQDGLSAGEYQYTLNVSGITYWYFYLPKLE